MDHINNKHEAQEDYRLENLQLLTPAQNLTKERSESIKQLKCNLNKPLSFYECKLDSYLAKYNEAKKNHDVELAHKLRGNICQTKARIRYYKAHIDEANAIKVEQEKAEAENLAKETSNYRASDIKELRKTIREAHEAYTKNRTSDNRYNWKLTIENLKKYLELHPFKS